MGRSMASPSSEKSIISLLFPELPVGYAHERSVEVYVFPSGKLRMKACAEFQKGSYASPSHHLTAAGGEDSGYYLQQGAFARAVVPDNTQHLSSPDGEGDVFQGPDYLMLFASEEQLSEYMGRLFIDLKSLAYINYLYQRLSQYQFLSPLEDKWCQILPPTHKLCQPRFRCHLLPP